MARIFNLLSSFIAVLSCAVFSATPWLHVDGKYLKDPNGNKVILRGVSTESIDAANGSSKNIRAVLDIVTNKSDTRSNSPGWYTRIVRLPVGPETYNKNPDGYINNQLKPAVEYATSKGLYVIIDLHFVDTTSASRYGKPNSEITKDFWNRVAPIYKDQSNILYELYNEPINNVGDSLWVKFRPIMQSFVDVVRAAAPKNIICASSPIWSQKMGDAATDSLTGGNIIYVCHWYNQHWIDKEKWNHAELEKCVAKHPMIMTEFGWHAIPTYPTETTALYGKPITDYMENLGISWTCWCASDDWAPAMFDGGWGLLTGDAGSGGYIKDLLYQKRDSDQPTDPTAIMYPAASRTPAQSGIISLLVNGRKFQIPFVNSFASVELVNATGRVVRSFGECSLQSFVNGGNMPAGKYVVISGKGSSVPNTAITIR